MIIEVVRIAEMLSGFNCVHRIRSNWIRKNEQFILKYIMNCLFDCKSVICYFMVWQDINQNSTCGLTLTDLMSSPSAVDCKVSLFWHVRSPTGFCWGNCLQTVVQSRQFSVSSNVWLAFCDRYQWHLSHTILVATYQNYKFDSDFR